MKKGGEFFMSGAEKKKTYIRNVLVISLIIGIIVGIIAENLIFGLFFGLGLWLGILVEMIPWLIAIERSHRDEKIIFWISVFFGYLIIPWLACIIWACQAPKLEQENSNKYDDLVELQKLKENGIITEIEFEVEKSKILR